MISSLAKKNSPGGISLKVFTLVIGFIFMSGITSGQPSLLPKPQEVRWTNQRFWLNGDSPEQDSRIKKVKLDTIEGAGLNIDEAYKIIVFNDSVIINATGEKGFYRAWSALNQLVEFSGNRRSIRGCVITDWPAFRIRGFMHDCGRSFIPIDELKKEIQILSQFKINTFHWHLTEDIAWRLASDIVPGLTAPEIAERDSHGYYSREEVKEFVRYCNDHFVEVIPEIDMPGHSDAFTRATGHSMQSVQGKKIVKEILNEACQLFEGQYFHLGTDEVKLTDPDFVAEMMTVVRSHGKEAIGWLPGASMDKRAVRHLWADVALPTNTVVIDSRYRYLNHTDYYSDLFSVYNSRLCDAQSGSDLLAGGICCVWNDRKPASVDDILVSNAFYPTMLAFAERSWVGGGDDIKTRGVRMGMPGDTAFERFRDFETRMMSLRNKFLNDVPFPYLPQTGILWKISSQIPNGGNLNFSAPFEKDFTGDPGSVSSSAVRFMPASGAAVYLRHTWGEKVPSFYHSPQPDQTAYAYTWIYSPAAIMAGLHFSTHNYGRSELDMAPPEGEWDYKRSRIWLNGVLVSPPVWDNHGVKPDHETPYANENMWSRPPVSVSLREGWNSLVIKLPVGSFSTPETRLVKWMFTAMIVSPDGKAQPCGLIYSPDRLFPGETINADGMPAETFFTTITGKYGSLKLPQAWSDGMVLQHDRPVTLKGMADKGETVEVTLAGRTYHAEVSATGEWEVKLGPLKAGGPYELMAKTRKDTVVIRDMLAGEVWFCSGQSNMEWPAGNSDGWQEIIESVPDENLRLINFRRRDLAWNKPWDSVTLSAINNLAFFEEGTWKAASPESIRDFSAVAYYFGRKLRKELGVPVGLIEMAVGGSPAEAWIERKALEMHPQLGDLLYEYRTNELHEEWVRGVLDSTLKLSSNPRQRHPFEPAYLFEAGISHLAGFPVRGFIWYQGESNANLPELYEVLLPEMVRNWRESWKDFNLPFYYAQLSSLNRPSWPAFRDSQRRLAERIPMSGMIVTTDIGHPTDVHPRDKKSVGERFAFLALNDTYGRREFARSPEPVKIKQKNNKIVVIFRYVTKLRTSDGLPPTEVEISETGDQFRQTEASLRGKKLIIKSPEAISVRYGWKPYSEGNLVGDTGLPVPTFKLITSN